MKYATFVAVEDADYGWLGLKYKNPKKMCNGRFTISSGDLLAHDCIEHQHGLAKIGSIGDEFVALGGVCVVRGQWGKLRRGPEYRSPVENLSYDVTGEMAELYLEQGVPYRHKLVKTRGGAPSGIVDDVIEAARSNWSKQFEGDEHPQEVIDSYLEDCRTFMLHGATLALRRFGDGHTGHDTYWSIERETRDLIKRLDYEGQEFRLGYDFQGRVSFEELSPSWH